MNGSRIEVLAINGSARKEVARSGHGASVSVLGRKPVEPYFTLRSPSTSTTTESPWIWMEWIFSRSRVTL